MPFYPSPLKDDGYDIADYTSGCIRATATVQDFKTFLNAAHGPEYPGSIVEMVLNPHVGPTPRGFKSRGAPRTTQKRDWYVLERYGHQISGRAHHFRGYGNVQLGLGSDFENNTTGTVFLSHQPDLNYDNPAVREAMWQVIEILAGHGRRRFFVSMPCLISSSERVRDARVCRRRTPFIKDYRRRIGLGISEQDAAGGSKSMADGRNPLFLALGGRISHGVSNFPLMPRMFMAVKLGGPQADHGHPGTDTANTGDLPMVHLSAQS